MNCPDYNSPASLKKTLDENGMAMQKKFGQNFLVNETLRKKIVDSLEIFEGMRIWEVGPGLGAMTAELLLRGAIVTVFEIDHGFSNLLRSFFSSEIESGKLKIVEGDVLKTWKSELSNLPDCFFGNLPYNVAARIIGSTIESGVRFQKMVVTIQKEVAQRMAAKHGGKEYSSFSVLCSWAYDIKTVVDLPGGNFWPVPNVLSRTLCLVPKKEFPVCKDSRFFCQMVRHLFSSRRKTIRNNLLSFSEDFDVDTTLFRCDISGESRVESVCVEKLLLLSDAILEEKQKFSK